MNWNSVMWAAIGGGIGGLIGGLLGKLVENKNVKVALLVAPVVLLGKLVPDAMKSHPLFPQTNMQHATAIGEEMIKQSPALEQFLKSKPPDQASAAMQEMAHAGLRRLSAEELVSWNQVRLHLAEKSPQLCATFWTGRGLTQQVLTGALNQLPPAESDTFLRTSMRAAALEVEQMPFVKPPADVFMQTLPKLKKLHTPADVERLDKVLAAGVNAPDEDGCWALQLLMKDSAQLVPADQEMFLRFIASL
jgi:hypothetical protein